MKSVFICYRRDDTRQASGRLYDDLVKHLGSDAVFKDIHSIEAGQTWRETIRSFIGRSDAILVLIGGNWQADRLHDPDDTLRNELELAREANLTIVPVLLDNTPMPSAESLPESLHWLLELQSKPLRDSDYAHDVQRLLGDLGIGRNRVVVLSAAAALVAGIAVALVIIFGREPSLADCVLPDTEKLQAAGVTPRFLQFQFPLLATGKLDRGEIDALWPVARAAATNDDLAFYMRCHAAGGHAFSDEQLPYIDRVLEVLADEDNASLAAFFAWVERHPFPGRVPADLSDIIITEFDDSRRKDTAFAVANRIETDLLEELEAYQLDNLDVAVLPTMARDQAQALADKNLNTVVIWGWYDAFDLHIRVMFGDKLETEEDSTVTRVSLQLPSSADYDALRTVMSDTLPATVSFLSLYLVGQLKYNADEYIEGNRAFDAAMHILPEGVTIDNPALVAFFEARRLQLQQPAM